MAPSLEQVLERHPIWRGRADGYFSPAVSTTYPVLDSALPGRGWPTGALTEILSGHEGIGELGLVLPALAALSWAGKRVVWLVPPHLPYAPALAAAGVDLANLVVVRAPGRRDALWAAEQVLRSRSCHAFVGWFRRPGYRELRRLVVAAEASPAWVVLFRPRAAAHEASPAALRIAVEPEGDALAVRILKRRGAPAATPLLVAVNRPFHALGRTPFPVPAAGGARADRRLGVPVHA
ncbi:MAG TPA: translesion DNA synthesis-associated protein ImuA [Burkholderiales bacterium]|nr:translesion DNA synthesis-associated protein ImuA [Burkholderiales bacterium]